MAQNKPIDKDGESLKAADAIPVQRTKYFVTDLLLAQ